MTFGLFGAILEGAADLTSDTVYHFHRTTNQALDTSGLGSFVPRPIRYAGDQFAGLAQHGIRDVGYTTGGVLRSFDGNVGPATARHGSSYQCGAEDRFGGGFQGALGFGTHASFGTADFKAGAAGYGTQSGAMYSPWGGQAQQPCYQPALPSSADPGPKISGGIGGNGGNGGASGGGGGIGQGVHIREETRFR
ncbi:hypothetical protein HMN09_01263900 [Mycena chlorophos]|uniref:Uncharacterized protein n=1 Tax=Mycena chlorophos TaxID=658473 RepID=A0A8H6VRV5_MYCCL|nr:hypothetical protein HMN09_01263900 [Mycena chlorophos]